MLITCKIVQILTIYTKFHVLSVFIFKVMFKLYRRTAIYGVEVKTVALEFNCGISCVAFWDMVGLPGSGICHYLG